MKQIDDAIKTISKDVKVLATHRVTLYWKQGGKAASYDVIASTSEEAKEKAFKQFERNSSHSKYGLSDLAQKVDILKYRIVNKLIG